MQFDLILFKKHLCERLGLSEEERAILEQASPPTLYRICERIAVSGRDLAMHIARFLGLEYTDRIDPATVDSTVLPASYCRNNSVVAVREKDRVGFVVSNPFDFHLMGTLSAFLRPEGAHVVSVAEPDKLKSHFDAGVHERIRIGSAQDVVPDLLDQVRIRYETKWETAVSNLTSPEESEPLILLVNQIIENAYQIGASDIHIEPGEVDVAVRYRVDGDLRVAHRLRPASVLRPLVSRIKIMSGLDISERRLPQDGRIAYGNFSKKGLDFDLRVSTAPTNFGEKVVMRIVDKQKSVMPLMELGFSERNSAVYRDMIRSPYGMILHVGPTGSGKSMTLYSALNELRRPEINIQTAEDPIEYTLPGISQLQVRSALGLTFHRALRTFLRQDPDVILVGEIRDMETVEVAVEAALTGHLLLSTLHTNDAPSTVTRLIQMGIEPFMVSSSIVLICAQRLVRRLCRKCKVAYAASEDEKKLLSHPPEQELELYRSIGCEDCDGIGYKGRIGVHELLVPNDELRSAINRKGITSEELKRIAVKSCDMTTLYWDGMEKARFGITSVQEVSARIRVDGFDSRPTWMLHDTSRVYGEPNRSLGTCG